MNNNKEKPSDRIKEIHKESMIEQNLDENNDKHVFSAFIGAILKYLDEQHEKPQ